VRDGSTLGAWFDATDETPPHRRLPTPAVRYDRRPVSTGADEIDEARLATLRGFVTGELGADPSAVSDVDVRLVEEEIIDSLGIFTLVDLIEERFGVAIDPEEITIDNFATLRALEGFVGRKLSQGD
jgi:acyl carrier protein